MEIRLINQSGVPKAEIEAHQKIQSEFDSVPFSKDWRGYASFALARKGRGAGDDDFDLVLVTHTNIVVIELKNWNGNVLESDGHKWFLDGEDRGSSPVDVVGLKAKKLASTMKQKLGPERTPFISSYVVLHGNIKRIKLSEEEERSVLNMTELLSFRYADCYKKFFRGRPRFNPTKYLSDYDRFFEGPSFKPKVYYIDGFRPEPDPIFQHPKNLYSEYTATAKDDPKTRALLRKWDFTALGLELLGETDRAFIGLREQRIYQYVVDQNEELSLSLLRPLSRKGPRDVTLDFAELFALPNKVTRLTEFTHSVLPKLSNDERVVLVKALLNRFAELHDLRVAHRDVGDHSIWLDRPAKVIISGLPAAYFPEMKTVGSFREKVKVEQSALPEDECNEPSATPYRRDIFMLGALAYLILYGEKPPRVSGTYKWTTRAEDPFNGIFDNFLQQALSWDPSVRFVNAREMLEAFNAATENGSETIIDYTIFEAFKSETKERDYEETEILKDDDHILYFRSDSPEPSRLVKVWYGIEPDPKRPDRSLRLLSFLERCRIIKGSRISGIQSVVDFGISRRSLLLVLKWVDGLPLSDWLNDAQTFEDRLNIAESLTNTVVRLHTLELAHGDIHPGNIIVQADGTPILIDTLDLRINDSDTYTTSYLPDNYASLSPFERDRYSLAAVLVELLDSTRDNPRVGGFPIPRVYEELDNLLSAETLSTLDPLVDAIRQARMSPEAEIPEFRLVVRNLAYYGIPPGELRSDNGVFHISAQQDRKDQKGLRIWVTGIGRQITFTWNLSEEKAKYIKVSTIPQSQLLRSQTMRDAASRMRITLVDGLDSDVSELAAHVLSLNELQQKISSVLSESTGTDSNGLVQQRTLPDSGGDKRLSARELWESLIQAEEESLLTVTVAGDARRNPYQDNQIFVPYHADSGVIDYDYSDTVLIESQNADGVWLQCGQLNLRDTTFGYLAELAIDNLHPRANLRIGAQLRLVSTLEKGSLTRRRFAVERILQDKAVIPSLIEYFDAASNSSISPTVYAEPSDEDLVIYSDGDKTLNNSQKEAFRRVLAHGPISMLQGPPGTGKTWFIACLLHYLITKEGVRRILLVSQAHEAVNNALEKSLELCNRMGIPFHAVRLGSEAATSDAIRHFHSNSIEQTYRERFKAERKERVVRLAMSLGLPREFSEDYVDLHFRLGTLAEKLSKLSARLNVASDEDTATLEGRIRALSETFWDIVHDLYNVSSSESMSDALAEIEGQLVEKYEVRSRDALERLRKLLRLSEEWTDSLGSPGANFSEFLAKTRTVVSGTLVGIGYRATGVVQNIFDWVIIDEAGRAAPSELAVAMQAGHRILLVGDHHQLPPTFSEDVRALIRDKFGVSEDSPLFASDFARIFDSHYGRQAGATLLTQYRMAPDIGELVSSCFYEGRLETGRGEPPEYYDFLSGHMNAQVAWIDTSVLGPRGLEQSSEDGVDRWNSAEARVVMGILRQLVEAEDFMAFLEDDLQPDEPGIGIICMYSKQRELIDKMKAEAVWLGEWRRLVKVDTVDSYQGKENRIVIISTVRNNSSCNPGFLRSANRINVAMSRAMERLYIVGAAGMWKGRNADLPLGKVYKKLTELVHKNRAAVLSANQFLVS